MIEQIASIDFLVTETEAEALLAEQQFIKRHRPRFNIRLRDDKSYPYIGISLDEEFPRVYFTRERHRSARIYFGPYSSAKRVRETLDLLGRLFQYRTCEGPEPGRRSGVPCLDYYIKRCAAPCVGYVDREEYRRGIDAIVDFLSGRYRDVERDLERKMAEAAGGGGVRARRRLPRPARGGALADGAAQRRRRVARDRRPGRGRASRAPRPTPRSSRSATGCSPSATASTSPTRPSASEAEVTEEFLAQYYSAAPAIPRLVVVGPGAARARRAARRGALGPPRRAGRGPGRRARLEAPPARARRAQRPSRWPRTGCARSAAAPSASTRSRRFRTRSGSRRCRCGSRASTSPTSAASTPSRRWSSSRAARRGSPTTGGSGSAATAAPVPTTSPRWRRCSTRRVSQLLEQSDRSPHDARARRELRLGPRPDRDRRRQGPALGRDEGAGAAGRARHGGDRAREAARGGLRPEFHAAAPYRHFRDRDALLAEVAQAGFERLAARLDMASTMACRRRSRPSTILGQCLSRLRARRAGELRGYVRVWRGGRRGGRADPPPGAPSLSCSTLPPRSVAPLPESERPPVRLMSLHIWAISHGAATLFAQGEAPMSPEEILESAMLIYLKESAFCPTLKLARRASSLLT